MSEPKQDHPEETGRAEAKDRLAAKPPPGETERAAAKDPAEATDRAAGATASGDRKETRPDAAGQDETVVDPETRLRDVLIGPAAGRRLE